MCYFDFIKTLFINHFNLDAQGCSLGFFVTEIPADVTLLENIIRESVSFFFSFLVSKVNLKY